MPLSQAYFKQLALRLSILWTTHTH